MNDQKLVSLKPQQYEEEWQEMVGAVAPACLEVIAAVVHKDANQLATQFYAYMMGYEHASVFLDHESVQTRLLGSLMRWMTELFRYPVGDVSALVAHQRHVGEVHARIQVPVYLVSRGARLIKKHLNAALAKEFSSMEMLEQSVSHVGQLMDLALEIMSTSYEKGSQRNARDDEAFRLYSVGQNIAVERERERAVLLEWGQEVFFLLHRGTQAGPLPSLGKSEFGLWFTHKAAVMFENDGDMEQIRILIERIDLTILPMLRAPASDLRPREALIQELQATLNDLKFYLSNLFTRHQEIENGRDTLTRLLNRRFLPSVMNREIRLAQTRKTSFALLLLDLDHFKRINDAYGHEAGDLVLQQVAAVLMGCVRNGDFIFRYGGEELLVMLVEVTKESALRIAEMVRAKIESSQVQIGNGKTLSVTASIGVAMYAGHPDHQYLIRQSDEAMYLAKQGGRNRVVCAP